MLCTFGVYWVAEGFGVDWVGGAWALIYLFVFWLLTVAALVGSLRSRAAPGPPSELERVG